MHRFLGCCVAMRRQAHWNCPGHARDIVQRVWQTGIPVTDPLARRLSPAAAAALPLDRDACAHALIVRSSGALAGLLGAQAIPTTTLLGGPARLFCCIACGFRTCSAAASCRQRRLILVHLQTRLVGARSSPSVGIRRDYTLLGRGQTPLASPEHTQMLQPAVTASPSAAGRPAASVNAAVLRCAPSSAPAAAALAAAAAARAATSRRYRRSAARVVAAQAAPATQAATAANGASQLPRSPAAMVDQAAAAVQVALDAGRARQMVSLLLPVRGPREVFRVQCAREPPDVCSHLARSGWVSCNTDSLYSVACSAHSTCHEGQ